MQTFKVNPSKLSEKRWADLLQKALWLKRYEMKLQAEMFSAMFNNK